MHTTEPLIDNRGTTIKVGNRVAYNFSGEIAIGTVKSTTAAVKDGYCYIKRALIKVEVIYPIEKCGHISVVKNPKNIIVLFNGE